MKKYFYALLILLLMPILVNAETLEYNICKSGCEYSTLDEISDDWARVFREINNEGMSNIDIIINFKDSDTYNVDGFGIGYSKSLTINGNGATINSQDYVIMAMIKDITINDLTIISTDEITIYGKFGENYYLNAEDFSYKNNTININNSVLNSSREIILFYGIYNINNSQIITNNEDSISTGIADIYFDNSQINFNVIAGLDSIFKTKIHLNYADLSKEKNYYRFFNTEENYASLQELIGDNNDEFFNNNFILAETPISDNITGETEEDITNRIYIHQDISKTIKDNTNINEYEPEFVNTYENSIGYDDIKDLPIEWKSDNDSVAKLENGVIIPVSAGNVDLIGTRGNDIYTIHLTVEKESLPEKIDKMTIKVPITGSKVKVWIVVISAMLLGIIGICSYLLIKNKKH